MLGQVIHLVLQSFTNISGPLHNIFLGGQAFQADGATRMQLVCADSNLSTQSIFEPIRKTG